MRPAQTANPSWVWKTYRARNGLYIYEKEADVTNAASDGSSNDLRILRETLLKTRLPPELSIESFFKVSERSPEYATKRKAKLQYIKSLEAYQQARASLKSLDPKKRKEILDDLYEKTKVLLTEYKVQFSERQGPRSSREFLLFSSEEFLKSLNLAHVGLSKIKNLNLVKINIERSLEGYTEADPDPLLNSFYLAPSGLVQDLEAFRISNDELRQYTYLNLGQRLQTEDEWSAEDQVLGSLYNEKNTQPTPLLELEVRKRRLAEYFVSFQRFLFSVTGVLPISSILVRDLGLELQGFIARATHSKTSPLAEQLKDFANRALTLFGRAQLERKDIIQYLYSDGVLHIFPDHIPEERIYRDMNRDDETDEALASNLFSSPAHWAQNTYLGKNRNTKTLTAVIWLSDDRFITVPQFMPLTDYFSGTQTQYKIMYKLVSYLQNLLKASTAYSLFYRNIEEAAREIQGEQPALLAKLLTSTPPPHFVGELVTERQWAVFYHNLIKLKTEFRQVRKKLEKLSLH